MRRFRPWIKIDSDIHKTIKAEAAIKEQDLETLLSELITLGYKAKFNGI
ncbi:hypothetical protein [Gloeothece verrucosa]|uniref:Uncharacterized protein n=1 Tax=Gloeothece verrucosa (strain PCC 7822) TaxID=497965 RepID=E0UD14_GLOV7|nr:hypothetical protein [Gloeothece verrucosa]ADN16479.1 hypothetical protein Cyan7822_4570 [Gloeothece verrucosa PCC 7822]